MGNENDAVKGFDYSKYSNIKSSAVIDWSDYSDLLWHAQKIERENERLKHSLDYQTEETVQNENLYNIEQQKRRDTEQELFESETMGTALRGRVENLKERLEKESKKRIELENQYKKLVEENKSLKKDLNDTTEKSLENGKKAFSNLRDYNFLYDLIIYIQKYYKITDDMLDRFKEQVRKENEDGE